MSDAREPGEADFGKPWIEEDGDESTENNATGEMRETHMEIAAESLVKEDERGSIKGEVVERIVLPGE